MVNEKVPGPNLRVLHVLAPATVKADSTTATAAAAPTPQPTVLAAPRQRPDPPESYRKAIAAHRATWTRQQHTNPKIQKAAER
ncbi:hypothetical protein [Streptomyces cyaneofuscatus]|uniref:hypothetical protein n=1 Tax=Streptomyces cyaneofuscatus TaxID=66883 RepID=UPI0038267449